MKSNMLKHKRRISFILALSMFVLAITFNMYNETKFAEASETKTAEELVLGEPAWVSGKEGTTVNFPELTVSTTELIHTVLVLVTPVKVQENGTTVSYGSIADCGTKPTMTDIDKTKIAVWVDKEGMSAEEAASLVKNITFNYYKGMEVKVIVDSNDVEGNFDNNTITTLFTEYQDHYYMYVSYPDDKTTDLGQRSWGMAYNKSKAFKFMGMSGYLATIATQEEASVLHNINDKAAWCGGTLLVSTVDNERLADPEVINKEDMKVYDGDDDAKIPVKKDAKNRTLYYWACGPEAGQTINSILWAENEPNYNTNDNNPAATKATLEFQSQETCVIANYRNLEGLNDIKEGNYTDERAQIPARAFGYFVEFGGYEADSLLSRSSQSIILDAYEAKGIVKNGEYVGEATAWKGVDYTATITADQNYELPEAITVTVDGKELVAGTGYTWDRNTGVVIVNGEYVTGDIVVKAVCPPYDVVVDVTNGSYEGKDTVDSGEDYIATITPDTNHELPKQVTVTVEEVTLTDGTDYTWDEKTGEVKIKSTSINGDVKVQVICPAIEYNVIHNIVGGSYTGADRITTGETYTSIITADKGYKLTDTLKITVGGIQLKDGIDYVWDQSTGKLTITNKNITGDVIVSATFVKSTPASGASLETGDQSKVSLYVAILLLAMCSLAACSIKANKKNA